MKKFFKSRFFYFIFITVFILTCLEIFGYLYLTKVLHKSTSPKFRFNSYRIIEHVPGFKEGENGKNWIVINNQGFRRIKDVSLKKPNNTFRIFLMGGSAAHGISSTDPYPIVHIYPDETIDACLEKMLKTKYPEKIIEVINAAVTSYRVNQHTEYILSELLDYQPDLFIFFDGANDHFINNPEYNLYKNCEYDFWGPRLQHPGINGLFNYFIKWMAKYSAFCRGAEAWLINRDATNNFDNNMSMNLTCSNDSLLVLNHKKAAKKTFLRSIESNICIARTHGIKCIVSLQPMLVLREKSLLSANECKFLIEDENIKKLYPIVSEELFELTKRYEVPFIDFNKNFNNSKYKSKQLLIDYCHLSPMGGKIVAEGLFPLVDSLINTK